MKNLKQMIKQISLTVCVVVLFFPLFIGEVGYLVGVRSAYFVNRFNHSCLDSFNNMYLLIPPVRNPTLIEIVKPFYMPWHVGNFKRLRLACL